MINERFSDDVVRQSHDLSCTSAVGEMLSGGILRENEILNEIGELAFINRLANILGPNWTSEKRTFKSLGEISENGPWGATLIQRNGSLPHSVVIDGINQLGQLMVRDPWEGTRYEMLVTDFMDIWTRHAVYKRKK